MKKRNLNSVVTNQTLNEAVDTILKGMDDMFKEERKFSLRTFALKEDLMSTKEDLKLMRIELKSEISWLRNDIKSLKADASDVPTRNEFNRLKGKVDKYLST